MRPLLGWLGSAGARSDEDEEQADQRRSLIYINVAVIPIALFFGVGYLALREPLASAFPLGYAVLTPVDVAALAVHRRFSLFRDAQLAQMLVLPLGLHLALGGFVPSSGVILWSLVGPLQAVAYGDLRVAYRYFAAFIGVLVVGLLFEHALRTEATFAAPVLPAFFLLNLAGVSSVGFFVVTVFVRRLATERARSERLLLNVLPREIAARLRRGSGRIADAYTDATIIFADVVNSTPLSLELSPAELVALFDAYVTAFDRLALECGVEKIRTIGDNWMGVAGVPRPRADHAERAARFALAVLRHVRERRAEVSRCLDFRIGLDSGPVVGGVVGTSKFVFDIWGDPVNTASRMESTGIPGRIQIGPATYALIRDRFVCEARGRIAVKGKGEMETYFLVGERA